MKSQIEAWSHGIRILSKIAKFHHQSTFATFAYWDVPTPLWPWKRMGTDNAVIAVSSAYARRPRGLGFKSLQTVFIYL